MVKKSVWIAIGVVAALAVASGLGVLIWWLVTRNDVKVIRLEGEGIGDVKYTAALTRIPNVGDMFWWFYPTTAAGNSENRPIIVWIGGAIGLPPSLHNLAMLGPYDLNLNRRNNSWIDRYNLLFIDAPLGTGFSTAVNEGKLPKTLDENAEHLITTLDSFYKEYPQYINTSVYLCGQAHGAQLALGLAVKLHQDKTSLNIRGVVLGNPIISPALVTTKLGFYLEELAYVDDKGRAAIENESSRITAPMNSGSFDVAFDHFLVLGDFVNEAGAVAVNLEHIVEKLTRDNTARDFFGEYEYLKSVYKNANLGFMNTVVGQALGVPKDTNYDARRENVFEAFRKSFMVPAKDKVEYLLQNTEISVSIYNGNMDAVSNTPGQLEWVDNLQWPRQTEFRARPRETLIINRLVEGYFRETTDGKLRFYWVNAAGQSAPLDSPSTMKFIISRIVR